MAPLQAGAQPLQAAPDPGFHRAQRRAQPLGQLGMAQVAQIGQHDGLALGLLQPLQAAVERARLLAGLGEFCRSRGIVRQPFGQVLVQFQRLRQVGSGGAAQAVQRAVAHDGGHPRHRRGQVRPVVAGVVPDADEAFLHGVLRPVAPASDTQREAKQFRRSQVVDVAQRLPVAQGNALQQRGKPVGFGSTGKGWFWGGGHGPVSCRALLD